MSQSDNATQPPNKENQSSPRRIAASRSNGAKSSGATTQEGKQKCAEASAKAHTKHGMLAQAIVLDGESQDNFAAFFEDLIAEHQPITLSEHICVQKMAAAYWRQVRTWTFQRHEMRCEMALQDLDAPMVHRASFAYFALCQKKTQVLAHRYESQYDRQYEKALTRLERLKANRGRHIGVVPLPASASTFNWDDTENEQQDLGPGSQPA